MEVRARIQCCTEALATIFWFDEANLICLPEIVTPIKVP